MKVTPSCVFAALYEVRGSPSDFGNQLDLVSRLSGFTPDVFEDV